MSTEPTLADYESLIESKLAKYAESAARSVRGINAKAAAQGRSGRTILAITKAAFDEFEKGLDAALTELRRVSRLAVFDSQELRQATERLLLKFQEDLKSITKPDRLRAFFGAKYVDPELAKFDSLLKHKLRQFDTGLFEPVGSEEASNNVSNHLSIGVMSGGAVQQGTVGSKQTQITISKQDISDALRTFEHALSVISLSEEHRNEVVADVSTIKAQLEKENPSTTILRETGKSLRNICEGAIGGVLAGPALSALLKALGL